MPQSPARAPAHPAPPVATVFTIGGRHSSGRVRVQRQVGLDRRHQPVAAFAIRLVHHEDVGDFHDAGFERLHLVAGARHQRHDRDIGRADDVHFILADANGFDDDDVLAGGVEHQRRVGGRARQSAEMAAGRHAPDEHARIAGVRLHPEPIAEHRAAAERAGRVDRDHADRESAATKLGRQPIDERALPRAGRTGHADEVGAPGVREDRPHDRRALGALVLDHRDRARDRARIAGEHPVSERRRQGRADHRASSCRAITSRWISLVPSPIVVSLTSRKYFSAG